LARHHGITFICCVMFFPPASWARAAGHPHETSPAMTASDRPSQIARLAARRDRRRQQDIVAGERHVIIGPNGAGKNQPGQSDSATIRTGSAHPCRRPGHHWRSPDRISRMGVARPPAQQPVPELSVIENLRLALECASASR